MERGEIVGILGVIVGIVLDRLPGVYVMLFAPMVDILMFQNPLATERPSWTAFLPSHFATNALMDAAFTTGNSLGDLLAAGGYVVALLAASIILFYHAATID
ncbi:hypothetical protein [Halobacterium hubeiense]|uniref:hypothetical protein n=1 Tax=Halobacterium hubeiense TaxID=1407499 RepID=UPI003C796F41